VDYELFMTIGEQAKMIERALAEWCKTNRGRAFIASDPLDCIDQLRQKPGTPTAAVLFDRREPRGELDTGRKDNFFKVVISRGRSLKLVPGESLTEGAAGGKPMFDLVEEAEAVVLGMRMDADDGGIDGEDTVPHHMGTGMFEVNGMLLDAYEVRFSLAAQATVQEVEE
jgi:hypothetical protein